MKLVSKTAISICVLSLALTSCLKDVGTKKYKRYSPIIEKMESQLSKIKSSTPLPITNAGKLFVIGNYVYLNEKEKGIHVIDNTNPANPINKYFITIPGNTDLVIKNNILYANCYTDIVAINISNINNVTKTKVLEDVFSDLRFVSGFTVPQRDVIVGWNIKDTIIDLEIGEGQGIWKNGSYITNDWAGGVFLTGSDLANIGSAAANNSNGKAGSTSRFALVNDYLYAVSNGTLNAINIANNSQPTIAGKQQIGWNIETIYPFKNNLFIGSQNGMFIYNLNNAAMPALTGSFSHARLCDPVIADDNYAYITLHSSEDVCVGTQNELDVVNITNLSAPVLLKQINLTKPQGLAKDGNTLFVCDDNAGLRIFDAIDPANPLLKQTLSIAGAYDIICNNGVAIISAKGGLYQYDYSNVNNITKLSTINY